MTKLSKRLQTICDLVPNNSSVIDVGADHGFVSIYLANYKNCRCLATDISSNCILKIKENAEKYSSDIEVMQADGLNGISLSDEIIIISGMGTRNILKILDREINNDLIISTHTNVALLKSGLYKKGYYVYLEKTVSEKHDYIITYYKKCL